jgi:hypothetical protein
MATINPVLEGTIFCANDEKNPNPRLKTQASTLSERGSPALQQPRPAMRFSKQSPQQPIPQNSLDNYVGDQCIDLQHTMSNDIFSASRSQTPSLISSTTTLLQPNNGSELGLWSQSDLLTLGFETMGASSWDENNDYYSDTSDIFSELSRAEPGLGWSGLEPMRLKPFWTNSEDASIMPEQDSRIWVGQCHSEPSIVQCRRHRTCQVQLAKQSRCEYCGKTFTRSRDRDRHVADIHIHEGNYYACSKCDYESKRKDKVASHCKRKHPGSEGDLVQHCEDTEGSFRKRRRRTSGDSARGPALMQTCCAACGSDAGINTTKPDRIDVASLEQFW